MKDVRDALMVARNTDGRLVRRPLSPHLQVYRWPPTMAASILNRATGIALAVGTLMLTWWLIAAATSAPAFAAAQWFVGSWIGIICLMGWTASLFYHLINGLRHLGWDVGCGFEKEGLNRTSWIVFGSAAVCTLVVWIAGFAMWR